jgi:anti-sigma factor RsiW
MDYKAQLKLQALLDGELTPMEAGEVTRWATEDREAAALLEELRNTRSALAGFETEVRMPESREFFWSKIEREIQRLDKPAPEPIRESLLTRIRRFLVPASAVAAVLMAGLMLNHLAGPPGGTATVATETALADSGAFTYHDFNAGATLVWLGYPADNEAAEPDDMEAFN